MKKSWFRMEAKPGAKPEDGEVCEIEIFDEIGNWGITAKDFIAAVKGASAKTIHLRINSPGGSVFDGLAIYNYLKAIKDKAVTCRVEGIAASMASVVACAASKLTIPANAYMMIHNPMGGCAWDADAEDMRKTADLLDKFSASIADIYAKRGGKTAEECLALMAAETWMDGKTCKEMGFCDETDEDMDMAACADVSRYDKLPDALKPKAQADVQTPPPETPAAPVEPPPAAPPASTIQSQLVPDDMAALLCAQVGNEMQAAYRYFAIAAACEAKGLAGFGGLLRDQGRGEISHAMKVYGYLVAAGAKMELPPIAAPIVNSSLDMLATTRAVLDQEMSVTADWQAISKLAKTQTNAATEKLAQEFMAEQIEEENAALTLHQRVKLATDGSGILTIDADLKQTAARLATEAQAKAKADVEAEITPAIRASVLTKIEAKAKADSDAKRDPRAEAKAMIDIFGQEKGSAFFAAGKTLEQAKDAFIDQMKAEFGKLKAANAELGTKLQLALRNPPIPFEATSGDQSKAGMRVDESTFEAYCKERGITGAKKDALRAAMIGQPSTKEDDSNEG